MKTFIQWLNEIAFTEKGRKEHELIQALKKREKKGAGQEDCPLCGESPCSCKVAKQNRIRTRQI